MDKIFIGMPLYDGRPEAGALAAFLRGATDGKQFEVVGRCGKGSLLAKGFNKLYCCALNAMREGVTHFGLLHGDIVPRPGCLWLDVLYQEMLAAGADFISAVVPLKMTKGVTSTAVDDPAWPWSPRRLTMRETYRLPETFSIDDVRREIPDVPAGGLLLNTGCLLLDLRKPWVLQTMPPLPGRPPYLANIFTIVDGVLRQPNGDWEPCVASEDWNFSRCLNQCGARLVATRKVKLTHVGTAEYPNDEPWGEQTDSADEHENVSEGERPERIDQYAN